MKFKHLIAIAIYYTSALHAAPPTQLPPKKPISNESQLGDSEAVREVQKLIKESNQNQQTTTTTPPPSSTPTQSILPTNSTLKTTGQTPPPKPPLKTPVSNSSILNLQSPPNSISVSDEASQSLQKSNNSNIVVHPIHKSEDKAPEKILEQKNPDDDVSVDVKIPLSRSIRVISPRPELGFATGWVFMRKDLANWVGDGFAYGVMASQELYPLIHIQLRLSGSHHNKEDAIRKSSLSLFPMEILGQFSRVLGNFRFYLQPGLGGALWYSKSERLVDNYTQKAKGFDFMASGGAGVQYIPSHLPWRFGIDASMSYVSGYFDNYFNRVLVYTTYQF